MSEFIDVNITKKANIYFNGKVTSRTVNFKDGTKKSLGVMLPGEYEFGTSEKEIMDIMSGKLEVLLPGNDNWINIDGEYSFEVPANSKFKLKIIDVTDYCCSYIK